MPGPPLVVRPRLHEGRRAGSASARSDITSTPSTSSGSGSSSSSSLAPTSPSVEPSSEASTSVLRVARPSSTRASSISAAVSAALPVASGTTAASRAATITIWRRERPARRPITFTSSLAGVREPLRRSTGKPLLSSVRATRAAVRASPGVPGAPVRRRGHDPVRLGGRDSRPSNRTSAASPCGSGRGPALQREHRQHQRQQGRNERRSVDARLESRSSTYNSEGDGFSTPDPACRRRAVGPEAADLPAAQGGLRRRPRARRPRGARPAARGQLRPRRARRDAAQAGRLRRVPPDPRAQHRADHHAHRQDRGDRQGARPRAGRRRLHHQAVLGARVPQPREGGAAARGAGRSPTSSSRSRSARATW